MLAEEGAWTEVPRRSCCLQDKKNGICSLYCMHANMRKSQLDGYSGTDLIGCGQLGKLLMMVWQLWVKKGN